MGRWRTNEADGRMNAAAGRIRGLDVPTVVAVVVLALGAVQLIAGALAVGVTFDEPVHVDRTTSWLEDGWYVPAASLLDGRPDSSDPYSSPYVYGPAFALLGHGANLLAGNDSFGEIATTVEAHAVRHLVVALIAALTAAAAGVVVWALSRSRRFGLWAAAALISIPAWTGQAFFNVKDVPAAAGYTLVTAGLVLAICLTDQGSPRRRGTAIGGLVALGIFIGAGTRISLWVPLLASLVSYAALRVAQQRFGGVVRDRSGDLAVAIGAAIGTVGVFAIYPNAFRNPLTVLVESVSDSASYPSELVTLTAGQLVPTHPPLWYLPAWVAASVPVLLGCLAVAGAFFGLRALARGAGRARWRAALGRPELAILLVIQQAILLPAAAIVGDGVMYDGIRQHLYVIPAVAILAGIGAERAWALARSERAAPFWRPVAAVLLSAALVVPMVEGVSLFPYNYAYVNPVAGIGGVDGRWETDYWFASAPEALERVPRGVPLRCSMQIMLRPGEPLEAGPCTGPYYDPFLDRRGDDAAAAGVGEETWLVFLSRAANAPPPYCEEADDVTRWLRGERVRMSYVLRCHPTRLP